MSKRRPDPSPRAVSKRPRTNDPTGRALAQLLGHVDRLAVLRLLLDIVSSDTILGSRVLGGDAAGSAGAAAGWSSAAAGAVRVGGPAVSSR